MLKFVPPAGYSRREALFARTFSLAHDILRPIVRPEPEIDGLAQFDPARTCRCSISKNLLFKHPAVLSTAIVGYPDPRLGERACAFVVLRPGQTLDLSDVQALMAEHKVAKEYWPERVEIVADLRRPRQARCRNSNCARLRRRSPSRRTRLAHEFAPWGSRVRRHRRRPAGSPCHRRAFRPGGRSHRLRRCQRAPSGASGRGTEQPRFEAKPMRLPLLEQVSP
jgi:AMP-binding enzyme